MTQIDLAQLCQRVVERAKKRGATQAEAYAERSQKIAVRVREGQIQDLSQATGKGLGLRVLKEGRLGFAYTSDFSDAALDRFVTVALDLAKQAARDENNHLPDKKALRGRNPQQEELYDEAIAELRPEWMIEAGVTIERAARAEDPRIFNFDSAGAGSFLTEVAVASDEGLRDGYRGSYVYLYAVPVARDAAGQLQTAYWVDYKRRLADLESPESVGRMAARRALRMLGARKAPTQRVPVVFEPLVAASFVAGLAGAVNGDMVYKKASFLGDKLGKTIAPESISIVDDALLPRGLSTAPFDGEGIPSRRTPVVEKGVLRNFLYDTYSARKAKKKSTGSAQRGYSSLPEIGITNFYLEPGRTPAEEIVRGVKNGLYVTAMLGRGANTVTGDYSRGANGLWIRGGELAEPVQEVTVAGHMIDMLRSIDAVGDDLDFRGSVGAPTIRFAELTVSGA
jgi:PmbA protein